MDQHSVRAKLNRQLELRRSGLRRSGPKTAQKKGLLCTCTCTVEGFTAYGYTVPRVKWHSVK